MKTINESIWDALPATVGDALSAKLAFPEENIDLYCAVDSRNFRHILIVCSEEDKDFKDNQSRGLKVGTRSLAINKKDQKYFIDIECNDNSGYSIFNLIGGEIATALLGTNENKAKIVSDILLQWRHFWSSQPRHLLPIEKQIGLFGELWFLNRWLIPKYGLNVLLCWKGPSGNKYDFEFPERFFEVKTSNSPKGHIHIIHGIDQLDTPEIGELLLFSLCLRENDIDGISLQSLINNCRSLLTDTPENLEVFETGLFNLGYSPIYANDYDKLKYSIADNLLFLVDNEFPKITSKSFREELSPGIEEITYLINLNTFANLVCCKNVNEFLAN